MGFIEAYPVTTALIAANIAASLVGFRWSDFYEHNLFQVDAVRRKGGWHRVITSAFLHVNPTHLLVNMYVLAMFGSVLEGLLGGRAYLFVYVAALIGAGLWMLVEKRDTPAYSAVGASGAVSGIVLGFCVFAPFAMLYLFFVIPMPAFVFGVGYIALSAWLSQRENTIVAHGAHLGGALSGLAATILVRPDVLARLMDQISNGAP